MGFPAAAPPDQGREKGEMVQPDTLLIKLARTGDQQAFAEISSRYFDAVYDFVARLTRDREETADITQDTFLKAMNALGGLQKGASCKSWIFTIARNTALSRLEKANPPRPLAFEDGDGDDGSFDVVDTDRFSGPGEAADAGEMASLVWQAAAGLDPRQLSLLDLHLRQGLESGEIAAVLGVTKNSGYVMLNRLKKAVEDAMRAFIMLQSGRRSCEELDGALQRAGISDVTPEVRKIVDRHVAQCAECEERRRELAPLGVFGAFVAVGSPVGAKAQILDQLGRSWPGPAAAPPEGSAGAAGSDGGMLAGRGLLQLLAGLGLVAAVLLAAILVPASPLSILRSDGRQQVAAADVIASPSPGSPSPAPSAFIGGGGSPTTSRAPGATPSGSAMPVASPTATTPGASPTATTPTAGPSAPPTVIPAATPTATRTPTATPTATPTPTPTQGVVIPPTPVPCTPSLSANTTLVNVTYGSNTVTLFNSFCASTTFQASSPTAWVTAITPASGTVAAGQSTVLGITAAATTLGEGQFEGLVRVTWPGGSLDLTVRVVVPGFPPVISSLTGRCSPAGATPPYSFEATVTDDYAVGGVWAEITRPDSSTASLPMSLNGASRYVVSGAGAITSWSIRATDENSPSAHVETTPVVQCVT